MAIFMTFVVACSPLFYDLVAFLAVAHPATVLKHPSSYPSRIRALTTHNHKVGEIDGVLLFDNTPLAAMGSWPHMALDEVYFLHHCPILFGQYPQNLAGLTLLFAGNHHDLVIFLYVVLTFFCHQTYLSQAPPP